MFGCGRAAISSRLRAFGGQPGQDGVGGLVEHVERVGIGGELVRVDEAAVRLVEGVGGEAVVAIEGVVAVGARSDDEAMDLLLRRRIAVTAYARERPERYWPKVWPGT